jgi:hypothetical protein
VIRRISSITRSTSRGRGVSTQARLVVLRGNSASGKPSVAAGIRDRFGRGLALVGQDNLRRVVLRERDRPNAVNIGLIDTVARYAPDAGYHVVLEEHPLRRPLRRHARPAARRPSRLLPGRPVRGNACPAHATKPIADEVGETALRDWHWELDLLPGGTETVIGANSILTETVDRIMLDTNLAGLPALDQ